MGERPGAEGERRREQDARTPAKDARRREEDERTREEHERTRAAAKEAIVQTRGWAREDLERIGGAAEIDLVTLRPDGSPREPVTLWVVRVGDALYVRSWLGAAGAWFRHVRARPEARIVVEGREIPIRLVDPAPGVDDAVDAAYRAKYQGLGGKYVEDMLSPDARATTLELVPEPSNGSSQRGTP